MIYTQQRRRALNKVLRTMYPDINFYENPNGIPVMECSELPNGAVQIINTDDFLCQVNEHCSKTNEIGLSTTDFGKAFPVFIRSMELDGRNTLYYYRVNYVSASEVSQRKAAEYITEGKLYAVM